MNTFVHRITTRFVCALRGIYYALTRDFSFKTQFFAGGLFVVAFWFLLRPLRDIEVMLLIFSWLLILITELQNSAFEHALDKLHPERHDKIGRGKDMAAGAVLTAGFFALCVVVWILVQHTI
jgi:diacylglycerol kinase